MNLVLKKVEIGVGKISFKCSKEVEGGRLYIRTKELKINENESYDIIILMKIV